MTEPTPVIQLGTYTFDSFNVLDQNMYNNSADNIAAFSNGMEAVADLNKKTNPIIHKIQKAQVGETINITINIINITVNFDLSLIEFLEDLTNINAALTITPNIPGDASIPMSFWRGGEKEKLQEIGRSHYDPKTGALTVNAAKMPLKYKLIDEFEPGLLYVSWSATCILVGAGLSGSATTKGTSTTDKTLIERTASYHIDAELFSHKITLAAEKQV